MNRPDEERYLNALATDFGSTGVTGSMRTAIAAPMAAACSAELASCPPAALVAAGPPAVNCGMAACADARTATTSSSNWGGYLTPEQNKLLFRHSHRVCDDNKMRIQD